MATFILLPGESATHSHDSDSTSTLVKGTVNMMVSADCVVLELNKPIAIPANTQHTMKNVGNTEARVHCMNC